MIPALLLSVLCLPIPGLEPSGHSPIWEGGIVVAYWLTGALAYWQLRFFGHIWALSIRWAQLFSVSLLFLGFVGTWGLKLGTMEGGKYALVLVPSMVFFLSLPLGLGLLARCSLEPQPSPSEQGLSWLERGNLKRAVEWLTLAQILGGEEAEAAEKIRFELGKDES